jgi:cobalt-zinc-cadmium efflux system membrane fusion protein
MNKFNYILFSIAFFVACKSPSTNTEQKSDQTFADTVVVLNDNQYRNAGIQIVKPVQKLVHKTVTINGVVDVPPQSMVSVSMPLGGYLKSTHLLPGTSVHKGEVIALMEDQSYVQLQQDYLVAKAKLAYVETDLQRQNELMVQDSTSKKAYQQTSSEYNVQLATLKAITEKLKMINNNPEQLSTQNISKNVPILSPINGYFTKVNINIGRYVNPSDVIFELLNPNDIHAAMTVFENDIDMFQQGISGKVFLTSDTSKKYDVEVILVTKIINDNRTGLLHCHFE